MVWQQVLAIEATPDGGKPQRFALAVASATRLGHEEKQQLFLVTTRNESYCFMEYNEAIGFVMQGIKSLINDTLNND